MTDNSGENVKPPLSRLARLDKHLFAFESLLNFIGGIIIFALIALTIINVLGRWMFDYPISGYIDWIEQSMAFFAFLGIAYCQRQGAHIRMDIVVKKLKRRWLWFSEFLTSTIMLLVTLILVYGSSLHALRAFELGDSSMDIELPTWPAKMIVPIALSFLALRLCLQMFGYARLFWSPNSKPVGIPKPTVSIKE